MTLAVPVRSDAGIGTVVDGAGDVDYTLQADAPRFERAALDVVAQADAKLVATRAAAR